MSGSLFVISAPSGAGKSTLCQRLLAEHSSVVLSISTTTRAPRGKEVDGREYYFVAKELFEAQVAAGEFAEWANVHGNLYGTSKTVIESAFAAGKSVLLDIDVQGAFQLKKAYGDRAHMIFISPPDFTTLEKRLRGRGTESEDAIQKRLRNAQQELAEAPKFEYRIVNDDLDRAYAELKALVSRLLFNGGRP